MDIGSCYYPGMKNYLQKIKIVAACLLLLSFFLPMSSCSYTVPMDLDANEAAVDETSPARETRYVYNYPREYLDLHEVGGWLNILSFFWPVPILLLQWKYSGRRYSVLLSWSGLLLSVLSAAAVYTWADIGKPMIGAYIGGGAAVALFVLYLVELVQVFRKRAHKES